MASLDGAGNPQTLMLDHLDQPLSSFIHFPSQLPSTNVDTSYLHSEMSPPLPFPEQPIKERLPPYLNSPSLLALNVLSPPVFGIIIALTTLVLLSSQNHASIASAKKEILAGCNAAQKAVGTLEALPKLLQEKSLETSVEAVEKSVRGVGKGLMMVIVVLEAIVKFLIDTLRSSYLCCLELVVFGGLASIIGAVEEISDAVGTTLGAIRILIQKEVGAANTVIQKAVSVINTVTKLVKVTVDVPEFSIPSLSALENVTIGTKLEAELQKLNSSLPTLDDIRTKLDAFIDRPFDEMILKIDTSTSNFTFTPSWTSNTTSNTIDSLASNSSTSLCSGLDLKFIDKIGHDLDKIVHWGLALLVVLGALAISVLLYLEHLRYKSLTDRIKIFNENRAIDEKGGYYTDQALMELVQLSQNGIVSVWVYRGMERWKKLGKQRQRMGKWFVALITHPLALMPLIIGIISLLSIQVQLAAIDAISHSASNVTQSSLDNMAISMASTLDSDLAQRGATFASDMNRDIAGVQTFLDDELLGTWVNTTTVVLNETLVEFYSLVTEAVNATFGNTILSTPVNNFLYCILGSKVEKLEDALTWIHANAHFTLPTVDPNLFAISNTTSQALIAPIAAAAVGTSSSSHSDDPGVVQRLINSYKKSLKVSRILPIVFIGLWGLVFLGGLATIWYTSRQERQDQERGYREEESSSFVALEAILSKIKHSIRPERTGLSTDEEKEGYHHLSNTPVKQIRSLKEAFPIPLGTSRDHALSPDPIPTSHSRQNSHFELENGQTKYSSHAWLVRPTDSASPATQKGGTKNVRWTDKLATLRSKAKSFKTPPTLLEESEAERASFQEVDALPRSLDPDHSLLSPSSLLRSRPEMDFPQYSNPFYFSANLSDEPTSGSHPAAPIYSKFHQYPSGGPAHPRALPPVPLLHALDPTQTANILLL